MTDSHSRLSLPCWNFLPLPPLTHSHSHSHAVHDSLQVSSRPSAPQEETPATVSLAATTRTMTRPARSALGHCSSRSLALLPQILHCHSTRSANVAVNAEPLSLARPVVRRRVRRAVESPASGVVKAPPFHRDYVLGMPAVVQGGLVVVVPEAYHS